MEKRVYKTLSVIAGVVLIVLGIGAFAGGQFASSFVGSQLKDQGITFPAAEAIEAQSVDNGGSLTADDVEAMKKYAGEQMSTGAQAKVWADNYIAAHMRGSAQGAGVPDDKATFNGIGEYAEEVQAQLAEEIKADNPQASEAQVSDLVAAEISNPESEYDKAQQVSQLNGLKSGTFFQGNMLRGTLLSAYGWGLIGTIARIAGVGLAVIGVVLLVVAFTVFKSKKLDIA